jgi:hypothetical protein
MSRLSPHGFGSEEMIHRQRALIRVIANEGGRVEKLRLFKLSFLLSETVKSAPKSSLYQFVPYLHGPYSFTLNHELRGVERDGWLRIADHEVELLQLGRGEIPKLERAFANEIDSLTRRYQHVATPELVSQVYKSYPWYTAKARNRRLRAAEVPNLNPKVFTVGYEGLMLDSLLNLLLTKGIKRLIDVRCNPVARRFGFHKKTLERYCSAVGIQYTHAPELGIPSSQRANLSNATSYERLFAYYEEFMLPARRDSVEAISLLMQKGSSALMCMEADPACCHRTRLARTIAAITKLQIEDLRAL